MDKEILKVGDEVEVIGHNGDLPWNVSMIVTIGKVYTIMSCSSEYGLNVPGATGLRGLWLSLIHI